jgi:hypothetical protein
MTIQMNYPSRKARTRQELFRSKKTQLIIITNFWLLYFILIGFIPFTNSTFSFFSDTETINNSFSAADNFCADEIYAEKHTEECKSNKRKDNSGIGNGPEVGDVGEGKTDPDNPKHGDDDDHPKPSESNNKAETIKSENLETWNQDPNYETNIQESKNGDKEKSNSPQSSDSPKLNNDKEKVETDNPVTQDTKKSPESINVDSWNQSQNNESSN